MVQIIKECRQIKKDKLAQGYEETPDGLLSPKDIKDAGYIKKDSVYAIPSEYIICEDNLAGHRKGQKILVISAQYMRWQKDREKRASGDIDYYIDKEIEIEKLNF